MVPIPNPALSLPDQDWGVTEAMCLWGEARSAGAMGMIAVANVIQNRVSKAEFGGAPFGDAHYRKVVLHRRAFDCFTDSDPNAIGTSSGTNANKIWHPTRINEDPALWGVAFGLATALLMGSLRDSTMDAVFYYTLPVTAPPHAWGAVEATTTIQGIHLFRQIATQEAA